MADDREVLREVWDGRIPACFSLASQEVETLAAPDPYYLMLPRQSYLPIVTDKVKKHLSKYVKAAVADPEKSNSSSVMWFEFDGSPLRWHLPIGVLFDQAVIANPELTPPWNITVHFEKFPANEIIRYESRDDVELHFMSSVKEADQIKHGGKVVSAMQKKDHNQLWQGLHNDKFDQFWAVNRRLMEPLQSEEGFKHLPLRMFDKDHRPMLQRLYKTVGEDRQRLTLRDLLREVLPDEDPDQVTQGIEPSKDAPLQWLSEHLSYPDNFLYICVK